MTDRLCTLVVLDSVGIGFLPDATDFGDHGADTLGHLAAAVGGLALPNLTRLGLARVPRDLGPIAGLDPTVEPVAAYGRMVEIANGKDTATGHWEFMGLVLDHPLRTFPDGFPPAILGPFLERIGKPRALCNQPASGTAVIHDFGAEHMETGLPIVYTSADPVLQIAAHEDIVPIDQLYAWCEAAYDIAIPAGLGRVIARPFVGDPDSGFTRTSRRRDFALDPPQRLFLDDLADHGVRVHGIGKIPSIYAQRGIARSTSTADNDAGIDATVLAMQRREDPLVFTNLVDFDMLYGHRRDPEGYAACLEAFDARLPELLDAMRPDDLLLITADHGNDPTWPGTDHTREYVPVLAFGAGIPPMALGTRDTFADLGRTALDFLGVPTSLPLGTSFLPR
ncbi:MAG: phosphopentomutase [Deltaproteobacteria bacterium]|nr:MAG: phosphopentomutase [Deltaproteobacteria bacterium]